MVTDPHPAAGCVCQLLWHLATIIPVISWQRSIPIEPQINRGLRPTLSIIKMAGIVVTTFMIPIIPVASNELVWPVSPRLSKMIGA